MRVGAPGAERPVVGTPDGAWFDLSRLTGDVDAEFLSGGGLARAADALRLGTLPPIDVSELRRAAPVQRPGVVVCLGQNYARHAAESGASVPQHPIIFYKAPNTVIGPDDDVVRPPGATKLDWEVELAVVIGRRAKYLDGPAAAADCIAGYAISNDVSERSFQLETSGGQWSKGKSCETFNPLGPWLVTTDEVTDPQALALRSWVNGELRQNANTKDMIFCVHDLLCDLSQYTVLEPGDLVNTGTPEGVALSGRFPYLEPGDVVELEIEGLGRQRQNIRRYDATS
jgi:2-keto-4-pentenoate hydratase/2-oxohepta-3-ene-1,7-dioic acid hydratase in catechol pathway